MGHTGRVKAFSRGREMRIKGRLVRGKEESGRFLTISWVSEQIEEKLSFTPYPGTLNIRIEDKGLQERLKGIIKERIVHKDNGFCDALIVRAKINERIEGGIVIPLVEGYPEDIIEVIAPIRIKDVLTIEDGDQVILDVE